MEQLHVPFVKVNPLVLQRPLPGALVLKDVQTPCDDREEGNRVNIATQAITLIGLSCKTIIQALLAP